MSSLMPDPPTLWRAWDTECDFEAKAWLNNTGEAVPFWSGIYGPHGSCQPGNWAVEDSGGFSLEFTPEVFDARFEIRGQYHPEPQTCAWCGHSSGYELFHVAGLNDDNKPITICGECESKSTEVKPDA